MQFRQEVAEDKTPPSFQLLINTGASHGKSLAGKRSGAVHAVLDPGVERREDVLFFRDPPV